MEQIQIRLLTVMSWILLPIFAVIIAAVVFLAVQNIVKGKVPKITIATSAVIAIVMFFALKWAIGIPPIDTPAGLRGMLVSTPYVFSLYVGAVLGPKCLPKD